MVLKLSHQGDDDGAVQQLPRHARIGAGRVDDNGRPRLRRARRALAGSATTALAALVRQLVRPWCARSRRLKTVADRATTLVYVAAQPEARLRFGLAVGRRWQGAVWATLPSARGGAACMLPGGALPLEPCQVGPSHWGGLPLRPRHWSLAAPKVLHQKRRRSLCSESRAPQAAGAASCGTTRRPAHPGAPPTAQHARPARSTEARSTEQPPRSPLEQRSSTPRGGTCVMST